MAFQAGVTVPPHEVLRAEAITRGDTILRVPADTREAVDMREATDTREGGDTREVQATMVAVMWRHVLMDDPGIADFTVERVTWVMPLHTGTPMIPATSTSRAMPTIRVMLTDRPRRLRPAPTAHMIVMETGFLVRTVIPDNSSISHRNRITILGNPNIRRRTTIRVNSSISSRSRIMVPIRLKGIIDNLIEACDIRSGF
jgi:hypothetical protein